MDSSHVGSSHATVRHTVPEPKKLYIEKTGVETGYSEILQSGIILLF